MLRKIVLCFFVFCPIALANITNGPYLQNVTLNSITIMWLSDEDVLGFVYYGETARFRNRVSGWPVRLVNESMWVYEITLPQLESNTKYHYQITSGTRQSADYTFKTAGVGSHFKFAVFGDVQRSRFHSEIAQNIVRDAPDIIVSVGDLPADGGSLQAWQQHFFNQARYYLPTIPFFTTIGNHDLRTNGLAYYLSLFSLPENGNEEQYYYFNYKNAKFIILDSFIDFSPVSEQYLWLKNILKSNTKLWTFVFFHKPPFSSGPEDKIDEDALEFLVPLFSQYHVDIVFNGHSHNYERSLKDSVNYIVTGGGGASLKAVNETENPFQVHAVSVHHHLLIEVRNGQLELKAISIENRLLDSLTLNRRDATTQPVLVIRPGIQDYGTAESELTFKIETPGDLEKMSAGEVSGASATPIKFQLLNNFPNPFNSSTQIVVDLPEACRCSILIYNLLGEPVRTLFQGSLVGGLHPILWNGTDDFERPVMSGLYFCRFKSDRWRQTIKMVLLE